MPFLFEKLDVYQKSLDLVECVSTTTREFPHRSRYLSDQFNRAGLSIALNIAEGSGRLSEADRRNFFGIALGSVHECVALVEVCRRGGLLVDATAEKLRTDLEVIAKMLSGLMAARQRQGTRAGEERRRVTR